MTKQEFIEKFAIQFAASYAVKIFEDCCSRGQHERLANLPWEDAQHIAEQNWDKFKEFVEKENT